MSDATLNQEDVVTYFGNPNQNPDDSTETFIKKNEAEINTFKNDQVVLLAEILKILDGENLSPEARDIFEANNISTEKKEGIKKVLDDLKENWKKFTEFFKKHKKAVIIGGVGLAGLIATVIFLL
jgi:hypothetical protein